MKYEDIEVGKQYIVTGYIGYPCVAPGSNSKSRYIVTCVEKASAFNRVYVDFGDGRERPIDLDRLSPYEQETKTEEARMKYEDVRIGQLYTVKMENGYSYIGKCLATDGEAPASFKIRDGDDDETWERADNLTPYSSGDMPADPVPKPDKQAYVGVVIMEKPSPKELTLSGSLIFGTYLSEKSAKGSMLVSALEGKPLEDGWKIGQIYLTELTREDLEQALQEITQSEKGA